MNTFYFPIRYILNIDLSLTRASNNQEAVGKNCFSNWKYIAQCRIPFQTVCIYYNIISLARGSILPFKFYLLQRSQRLKIANKNITKTITLPNCSFRWNISQLFFAKTEKKSKQKGISEMKLLLPNKIDA